LKPRPESPLAVRILTLGCKVNQHESACLLEGLLESPNFRGAGPSEAADLCIVNTCAVTRRAEADSRRLIGRARRQGARVIAAGCAVEADPSLGEGCELAVGNASKPGLAARLRGLEAPGHGGWPVASRFQGRARATLKVQDGCNSGCAYCIVPRLRGRSRSLPREEIVAEVERLAGLGFSEAVLCAIHLGAYGADLRPPTTLAALLRDVTASARTLGLRVRLSSLEPQEALELLPLLASPAVCRHLHVSLQSGSDRVLARMRRRYPAQIFRELVLAASEAAPGLAIGCDVIAGFPGETEEEFSATYGLLEALPVSYLHVFPFSPRPGTLAATMPAQVPAAQRRRRAAALRDLSARKRKTFFQAQVGSLAEVVVQGRDRVSGLHKGLTDNYVPVLIDLGGASSGSKDVRPGGLMRVRAERVVDSRLIATPL
jgi:threonylcarbamoyladenosine tRNA methylthiotransferase MtaB